MKFCFCSIFLQILMRCFKQLIIISLEVNLGIYFGTLVTLHVICDVIGIALYLSKNPRWRPCVFFFTVSDFEVLPGRFIFENVGNKPENDWTKFEWIFIVRVYELVKRGWNSETSLKKALPNWNSYKYCHVYKKRDSFSNLEHLFVVFELRNIYKLFCFYMSISSIKLISLLLYASLPVYQVTFQYILLFWKYGPLVFPPPSTSPYARPTIRAEQKQNVTFF